MPPQTGLQTAAPASPPAAVREALALFRAGRADQAEARLRSELAHTPDAVPVLRLLAALRRNAGDMAEADALLGRALALDPHDAGLLNELGAQRQAAGDLGGARRCYCRAIRLAPGRGEALVNLGNLLRQTGKTRAALACYGRAERIAPGLAGASYNLGVALGGLGRAAEAEAAYRRALARDPAHAKAHNNLGLTLKALGRAPEAVEHLRRALALAPGFQSARLNLANALLGLGRLREALEICGPAAALAPGNADAAFALANALKEHGRPREAADWFRAVLAQRPDFAEAHCNLGNALRDLGRLGESIRHYRRTLELRPDLAEVFCNLSSAYREMGRPDEAAAAGRRAVELAPDFPEAHSALLFTLNAAGGGATDEAWEAARRYGLMLRRTLGPPSSRWGCERSPRRLRVGVVSGDLRQHPVGYFLEAVLAEMDPGRVAFFAYHTQPATDAMTGRLAGRCAGSASLHELSDRDAAARIQADGVHLLLDLSGHTAFTRLPVFARRPAPVQASWLGYFATTGLDVMDFLLADPVCAPEASPERFTEAVWRLPDTRFCFTPPADAPDVAPLPALATGSLNFGCFQNMAKLGDRVLALWARILTALPSARLHLRNKQLVDADTVRLLEQRLAAHGFPAGRVVLHPPCSRRSYLAAHAGLDVLLDTFPYPGGTTTCEALWMGVPTLTLCGDSLLARQGAGLLRAAGLREWVAESEEDYVRLALSLPGRTAELAALRQGLREQVRRSPLFDAARFARNLEAALWGMWERRRAALGG